MKSIFTNKEHTPSTGDLTNALGDTFTQWNELAGFAKTKFPGAVEAWHFSGAKYGWSFRISDKKRVILYLLPRDKFFRAAFVFGEKALNQIMESDISDHIKRELAAAKPYAEGRGIRIDIRDASPADLMKLIAIKIEN